MSSELDEVARALFNGQIPNIWRKLAPATLKTLGNWMEHFQKRLDQYNRWVRDVTGLVTDWRIAYVASYHLGRFLLVRSGRARRTGSGQFKWKRPRRARTFLPASTLHIPALWPTGAEELSGSDP